MPAPGIEPGSSRPQPDILPTILYWHNDKSYIQNISHNQYGT